MHNSFLQCIDDKEPIDDRLMSMTLRGTLHTTIATCMPVSDRPYEEKARAYDNLQTIIKRTKVLFLNQETGMQDSSMKFLNHKGKSWEDYNTLTVTRCLGSQKA